MPDLRTILKLLMCAVGVVVATYGTVGLNGLSNDGRGTVLAQPSFWYTAIGTMLTALAFESFRRSSTTPKPSSEPTSSAEGEGSAGPEGSQDADETPEDHNDDHQQTWEDEHDKLSLFEVVGLAAGGVVGSGWILAVPSVQKDLGHGALLGWALGGLLMLAIAFVMVEFGLIARRTGGLLFHPHDAFGPLVVVILAASLWISYAVNPAAQAAASVSGLADLLPQLGTQKTLHPVGSALAVLVTTAIVGFVLLPKRLVLRTNAILTLVKVAIPVLLVVCLGLATIEPGPGSHVAHAGTGALSALLADGILYAYIGFQAPLDVTGEVRASGRLTVAARVRWAVYGTVVGSFLLYSALQVVYAHQVASSHGAAGSPYIRLVEHGTLFGGSLDWLVVVLRVGSVIAPIGSGIVFTYALTREVYSLSANRYVPGGLHESWASRLPGRREDSFWLILLVNLVLALVVLLLVKGSWHTLTVLNTVPILVLYAVSCVVLAVRVDQLSGVQRRLLPTVAYLAFVMIAVVVTEASWHRVWIGMTVILSGSAVLLLLPWLAQQGLPGLGWYDAKHHGQILRDRHDAANHAFLILTAYLATLTALRAARHLENIQHGWSLWSLRLLVVLVATGAYGALVDAGRRYVRQPESPSS